MSCSRLQVIRGWDNKGQAHERVYDVAVSGNRKIGTDGRSNETVGHTVNVKDASFNNSIGSAMLQAHWREIQSSTRSSVRTVP